MTAQEAIKTIELAIAEVEWNFPMDYAVAFEKAIDALKKLEQIESIVNTPVGVGAANIEGMEK